METGTYCVCLFRKPPARTARRLGVAPPEGGGGGGVSLSPNDTEDPH